MGPMGLTLRCRTLSIWRLQERISLLASSGFKNLPTFFGYWPKIMASGPITSGQIDGETMETMTDFIFLGSKITAAIKLKDACSLEEKL